MVKIEDLEFELDRLELKESDFIIIKMAVNDYKISDQTRALKIIRDQCVKAKESLNIKNKFIFLSPDQIDISKLSDEELKNYDLKRA